MIAPFYYNLLLAAYFTFVQLGLRTLVIAGKKITEGEFRQFIDLIETAKQDLQNRDQAVSTLR